MSSLVWNAMPVPVFDAAGDPAALAEAYFFLENTTTPLTTYSDYSQTTPHAHPVVANGGGVFPAVYIPYSATGYKVRVTTAADVTIFEIDGIARTAPPESGGGGGIEVAVEQVFQTGWITFLLQTGAVAGFVRLNGRTMGNGSSGATERANADTADLFTYFYTHCSDAICPVSGGRGANAAADFAANKTITLPDFRAKMPMGLDDMGNSALSGFTGVSFDLGNATTVGATGGDPTSVIAQANLPNVNFTVSGTISNNENIGAVQQPRAVVSGSAATAVTGFVSGTSVSVFSTDKFGELLVDATHSLTAASGGSGTAKQTISPFMLGGWYAKV